MPGARLGEGIQISNVVRCTNQDRERVWPCLGRRVVKSYCEVSGKTSGRFLPGGVKEVKAPLLLVDTTTFRSRPGLGIIKAVGPTADSSGGMYSVELCKMSL